MKDESQMKTLEAHLATHLFVTGHLPAVEDRDLFNQFAEAKTAPCAASHPALSAWFQLVEYYTPTVRNTWISAVKVEAKKGGKPVEKVVAEVVAPVKAAEVVDDDDLFGDEPIKVVEIKKKEVVKPKVIGKSLVIIDVKVWSISQDLDKLAAKILAFTKDGLFWKSEYKLIEVGFGIKKIRIGMTIIDEKISVDDDVISALSEFQLDAPLPKEADEEATEEDEEEDLTEIQSIDIVSFDKI